MKQSCSRILYGCVTVKEDCNRNIYCCGKEKMPKMITPATMKVAVTTCASWFAYTATAQQRLTKK